MRARGLHFRHGLLVLIGAAAVAALLFPLEAGRIAELPLLALASFARMVAAYALALVFALGFGTMAATNKRAATVMLPLLDVLQSIPILGFFPAALVFFVTAFQGHPVGLEFAVVFLIFTSMAWNMAFGVYESLTTIPGDLQDAARTLGLDGTVRFRRLNLPAMVPRLVHNSVLSWTNGWFFLVASEVFSAFGATYSRPGIGAYIARAGLAGDGAAIAFGLGTLAAMVLALDMVVWRPLSLWSQRFRVEGVASGAAAGTGHYEPFRWMPTFPRTRRWLSQRSRPFADAYFRASARLDRGLTAHPKVPRTVLRVDLSLFLVVFLLVVVSGLIGLIRLFSSPLPPGAREIPLAAVSSFLRLGLAYLLAIAWTIPAAVFVGRNPRASRLLTPLLEVFASLPATALLPVILGFSLVVAGGLGLEASLAALLIAVFAMQWYLLFNLIGGVRTIPGDLEEAARAYGLRGLTYWRRVLLPAMIPSLVTGSITAWGAGWNALVVSEYIRFGDRVYEVPGLGQILNRATFGTPPDYELLLLTILAMIVVVLVMNKALWRPLFNRASLRYRMDV